MPSAICRIILITAVIGGALGGCASEPDSPAAVFQIEPEAYPRVFEAAQRTLVDRRFPMERIDARAGVLTTGSKASAGLATPWDTEQTTFAQEFEDFLNTTSRSVRITFEPLAERMAPDPVARAAPAAPAPLPDLHQADGPIVVEVRVALERTRRPGQRLDPSGIGLGFTAFHPEYGRRGMMPQFTEPVGQDGLLARRLAEQIRRRAGVDEPGADDAGDGG